jgi:Domain of unknown function (DUF6250)
MQTGLIAGLVAVTGLVLSACSNLPHHLMAERTGLPVSGTLVHSDDFRSGLSQWSVDLERGGTVEARDGTLDIDVPAGATVWFRTALHGPVMIEYEAVAVDEGGPNDHVSDLNVFWMASDPDEPGGVPYPRSGAFADYDDLLTYYVGQGGNRNTTTRMRRYVGQASNRPLLAEHDLSAPEHLLRLNVSQTIRLVAAGSTIQYWRDGRQVFAMNDPAPYTRGWFGIRTTASHLRIRNFRVYALPSSADR